MTPTEFAKKAGCSVSLVKALIVAKVIKATKRKLDGINRYAYDIDKSQLRVFEQRPKKTGRGWKLGRKRKVA